MSLLSGASLLPAAHLFYRAGELPLAATPALPRSPTAKQGLALVARARGVEVLEPGWDSPHCRPSAGAVLVLPSLVFSLDGVWPR